MPGTPCHACANSSAKFWVHGRKIAALDAVDGIPQVRGQGICRLLKILKIGSEDIIPLRKWEQLMVVKMKRGNP